MYVNEYTRERNADVVLLLDAFEDAGAFGSTVLDQATRIVASLARYFLTGNNRVGCIELSGLLRWVSPNLGTRQQYRILEFLTDVRARDERRRPRHHQGAPPDPAVAGADRRLHPPDRRALHRHAASTWPAAASTWPPW